LRLWGGDDGHRVGVAEGVVAAFVADESFEEGEHQSGGGSDRAGDRREAEWAGILRGRDARVVVLFAVGAVDVHACALFGWFAAVEAGEDSVGGRVGGDLEELVEPLALLVVERMVAADALSLFDHPHKWIFSTGVHRFAAG
jgi:hypothetical protein